MKDFVFINLFNLVLFGDWEYWGGGGYFNGGRYSF